MAVYVNSAGKVLLNASGTPMLCSTCPCNQTCTEYIVGDPDCPGVECCFDAPVATCYTAAFPSITDGVDCTQCNEVIAGPWEFDFTGDVGTCQDTNNTGIVGECAGGGVVLLQISASGGDCRVILKVFDGVGFSTAALYQADFAPGYDVTQGFLLDYVSDDGSCNNWPATVQVSACF